MTVHFISEIDNLTMLLLEVTSKAEHAVHQAIQATLPHDVSLAQKVIDSDDDIDVAEIGSRECLKILALYQPVAGICARSSPSSRSTTNRRVGDLAVNIAERVFDGILAKHGRSSTLKNE